jgi:hypothetical protein
MAFPGSSQGDSHHSGSLTKREERPPGSITGIAILGSRCQTRGPGDVR